MVKDGYISSRKGKDGLGNWKGKGCLKNFINRNWTLKPRLGSGFHVFHCLQVSTVPVFMFLHLFHI